MVHLSRLAVTVRHDRPPAGARFRFSAPRWPGVHGQPAMDVAGVESLAVLSQFPVNFHVWLTADGTSRFQRHAPVRFAA
jgi:hypothetical protein